MFRFKELFEIWRSDNLLTQAFSQSYKMLEHTHEMFSASVTSLRQSNVGEMDDVYQKDQLVNEYERKVRRKVLKHLAITGGTNVIPGLILTSIVIDIERIGDYTKNIKDLAVDHPRKLHCGSFEKDIEEIESKVEYLFERTLPILRESRKDEASKLIKETWPYLRRCDEIMTSLIKEEDASLSSGDAVSTAIYARFLKRVAAHLINVLTSVVNPFDRIGFHEDDEV